MDLSTLEAKQRRISLRHPATSEPIGLHLTLRPLDSPEVEKVRRRNINKRLAARNQRLTAEQIEANAKDLLVAAVAGWEWDEEATFEGEQLKFNEDNVRKVLSVRPLREQVDEELGDDAAFFTES